MNFFQKIFLRTFFQLIAVLEAKAGAKIKHIFETTKYFGNFLQNIFKNLFFAAFRSVFVSDCGCKGSALFLFSKLFYNFFFTLFRGTKCNYREYQQVTHKRFFRPIKRLIIYINIGIVRQHYTPHSIALN